ncbi:glycerophosphoryl diester phosphodiesterase membrane domain-containing protein [Leucobacter allii]|uniref:glycerophosphoryl diester phosphodiesterase membrane domain-containing protein n=1 Tax=Leucobacter allii TaxID=2932247 RepID=UPI001FD19B5F|nr:glycerophosphoryl diester phosphodiesterase membrane domain-containing protein [Leucobacter allii]UOR01012.1 glycerophosphoryl diester phosphodiesterase membrane domain-containing protein [Leucobacter allii]
MTHGSPAARPSPRRVRSHYGRLLREGWRLVRAGGARLAGLVLLSQLVILLVALPLIGWLFREALRASGMHGLDTGNLRLGGGFPVTLALLVVIVVLAFWLISLQFTALVVLLRWPGLGPRAFLAQLRRVARKLVRPGSASLLVYLFLLLPLTGFGFTSTVTRGIAIPPFISGELAKSPASSIALTLVLIALALLNVRLSLTVPVFVLTDGGRASRGSWRLTRGLGASVPLVLAILTVLAVAGALAGVLFGVAIAPTALADAIAPDAAPIVAAYSLGAVQVAGFLLSGFATAMVAAILIARVREAAELLPAGVTLRETSAAEHPAGEHAAGERAAGRTALDRSAGAPAAPRRSRRPIAIVALGAVIMAAGFGTAGIGTMQRLSGTPDTLVLAHRGFSDGGVENTIGGLEAAAAAGAELVEMDVMQTQDGGFIAMHDPELSRLAGRQAAVKDLTLAELTAITVRDGAGHEDTIPAFADYVRRAAELEMPLLIEIKLGGADTEDHVARLVAELESLDALETNIYHSLDAASVAELKRLRPDLTVGYTMPFAGGDVPDTAADFIVVEQWTATRAMQDDAWNAGLGFMAWTVNDDAGIREHLRRDTDGIITDHPDLALSTREQIDEESGLADALLDTITRFVTVV